MMQIEARVEELKKIMDRVKILKGFQVACRKRMGRALSQKRDPRVQLISLPKQRFNSKLHGKKSTAIHYGPPENSHVASFREALTQFAVSLSRKEWSKEEREKLGKGVEQQFREKLFQHSVNLQSDRDECSGESGDLDGLMASIRDLDIAPETMRLFLPKVNWDQVASMYLPGRSGAECQSRFLNWEDPLIKHEGWDVQEEKNLLQAVQQKGMSNWIDISASLGVRRTPFQCLSHYQRSLNASIIRREWTEEEDIRLCAVVESFGESNWQEVASVMEGRTGTQCSNRWIKSLHPAKKRSGKWSADEDKRLKVAVMLFYPKTWRNIGQSVPWRTPIWKKVAQFVPGRTHVQCRERWVNSLDPSLKLDEWTEEEDLKLKSAIDEHGYSWSKVAACIPPRTDNQCRRRWKVLFPDEVPMLQEAKKMRREVFISNFVDREEQRPALKPDDLVRTLSYKAGCETTCATKKRKLRSRAGRREDTAPGSDGICKMEKRISEESEGPQASDLLNNSLLSSSDYEIERILDVEQGSEQRYHGAQKNNRPPKQRVRRNKKFAPNNQVLAASASSEVESPIDGRKKRRASSRVKKKYNTVAFNMDQHSSVIECGDPCISRHGPPLAHSHLDVGTNDIDVDGNRVGASASTTRIQDASLSFQRNAAVYTDENARPFEASAADSVLLRCSNPGISEGENAGASGCDLRNKCNQLKHNDRSAEDNLLETAEDCTTLASFISKSRAKRCSLSSTKRAKLHQGLAQPKGMTDDNSSRSCISDGDRTEKTVTQDCTSSNQIPAAEVGDDMPLSLFMRRAKRKRQVDDPPYKHKNERR